MRSVAWRPFTGLPCASTAEATMRTLGKSDGSTCVMFSFTTSSASATTGPARPSRSARPAASASRLDIDARHAAHRQESEHDQHARGDRRDAERAFEEQLDVVAADEEQGSGDGHRQQCQDVGRVALLRGQGANVTLDADALTQRATDVV